MGEQLRDLARNIERRQAAIHAEPFAPCSNCGASSHMAAPCGICLGCEMGARVLFDLMTGAARIGGPT